MYIIGTTGGTAMPAKPVVAVPPSSLSAQAEQITGFLKRALQTARIAYLGVGRLLADVRERSLFAALGYADLESYARERLQLGRSSLYSYLRVHDWVAANHPDWLIPGPNTYIPELNDVVDLIWIERELERKDLTPAAKSGLEKLQSKALTGELKKKDVPAFRKRVGHTREDGRLAFLVKLKALRAEGAKLAGLPPEIVAGLDDLIAILKNAVAAPTLTLDGGGKTKKRKVA